ncbi:MAG TPA: hypothetical protein VNH46_10205 [Gemmatimonadales bacterium]|nr:hypothetical protein [Gemmatimonadales bacterium]
MKLVLLLVAIGLFAFAFRSFMGPYHGLQPVTTPAGRRYEVQRMPDDCQWVPGTCIGRVVFVSHTRDTTRLKGEAEGLLPWIQTQGFGHQQKALLLVSVEPGFARLLRPTHMVQMAYGWRSNHWEFGGLRVVPDSELAGGGRPPE